MLYFSILVFALWPAYEAIEIDYSIHDWYGNSAYPLHMEKKEFKSADPQCNLIASLVKTALWIKKLQSVLTEAQLIRAEDYFDSCLPQLCRNQQMIDAFQKRETFREQINILIAKAKMPDLNKKKEKVQILQYLIAAEYQNIYSGLSFPPTEDSLDNFVEATGDVIESVCEVRPDEDALKPNVIVEIAMISLVDRYVSDAFQELRLNNFTTLKDNPKLSDIWIEIAERIIAPDSLFTSTCLDPSIAFYGHERPSITRVREIAASMNLNCGKEKVPKEPVKDKEMAEIEDPYPIESDEPYHSGENQEIAMIGEGSSEGSAELEIELSYSYAAAPPAAESIVIEYAEAPGAPGSFNAGPPSAGPPSSPIGPPSGPPM